MPQKTQIVQVPGKDINRILSIAYGSLRQLGWTIKYAGPKVLIGYTPRSWTKYDEEITITAADGQLSITSKMIHNEMFDMMGKNKKHVRDFVQAFENLQSSATSRQLNEWEESLTSLRGETVRIAEQETKQAQEVNSVMNLSGGNMYATYAIMAINVLVFIGMVATGIDFMQPTVPDILKWGANYLPLTADGEWWRLISNVFVHIGIIHLLFNMYALYTIGVYLEPMLGKSKFIIAYLSTGVFASLASLWWHHPPISSAGASGAIFGMYGVFLALLTTQLVPQQVRKGLLQSIGIFVVYNLVYGMKSGVDNSAHIGGLLSGFVIGYLYYGNLKNKADGPRKNLVPGIIALLTVLAGWIYLQDERPRITTEEKQIAKELLQSAKYKDEGKFLEKYNAFIEIQNTALAPFKDSSLTDDQKLSKITEIGISEWNKAQDIVNEVKTYNVPESYKRKTGVMQDYVDLRKNQINLIKQIQANSTDSLNEEYKGLIDKINDTVSKLDSL